MFGQSEVIDFDRFLTDRCRRSGAFEVGCKRQGIAAYFNISESNRPNNADFGVEEFRQDRFARSRISIHAMERNIAPTTIISIPLTRARRSLGGSNFSASTKPVIAAIHSRFITPPRNNSAMIAQQQPRQ